MTIRAVIFDFYGTLARVAPGTRPAAEILGSRGLVDDPVSAARWGSDALNGLDLTEHSTSAATYETFMRGRRRMYLREIGAREEDVESLLDALAQHSRSIQMEPYPDATVTVEALRRQGMALALCSNWDWDLDTYVDRAGFADRFAVSISSARAGCRKPHPRIYAETVAALGVDREEALYVGDSWVPDVEGPRRSGLRAIYVQRRDRPPSSAASEPAILPPDVLRVPDLLPIVDLVSL